VIRRRQPVSTPHQGNPPHRNGGRAAVKRVPLTALSPTGVGVFVGLLSKHVYLLLDLGLELRIRSTLRRHLQIRGGFLAFPALLVQLRADASGIDVRRIDVDRRVQVGQRPIAITQSSAVRDRRRWSAQAQTLTSKQFKPTKDILLNSSRDSGNLGFMDASRISS
jgi:hypothetical protein